MNNIEQPNTPEQLMRSRYTAYALGGHGQYLLQTWFPATANGLTADDLNQSNWHWIGLQILSSSERGDQGAVHFRASYRDADGAVHVMEERSAFIRTKGKWLYLGGEVS